ncbi:energy-coupled thiamine transporter ThiT [Alteribacillus sp. HJP-4]|uniref:energy-coupled thiamine transporter ThiT n=1 Tax=Alteribacillus sp. HJP-4 TaxID=2775394 RepID=UPI0035CCECE0
MQSNRLVIMIEVAIMAALAVILSYIKFSALWAMGGSISLVMVPIFIMAFRRGWKIGVLTGFIYGMVQLLFGPTIVHPVQYILEYPIAFAVLGFAGVFAGKQSRQDRLPLALMITGIGFATLLRFLDHFASGIIWFGAYAPDGMPVSAYSAIYNASYLVPEMLITMVIVVLISRYRPQFFIETKRSPQAAA